MINTCQTALVEADYTEPFEDRIDILFRELELATKWQCPSLLLAIYSSEYVHGDAQLALENRLLDLGQKAHHIIVKSPDDADIPLLISELTDLSNAVVFVEGLRWGGGEADINAYRALNKHREFFIENRIRVVFWLTETEAIDLAHHAPDYWAFRHRVIEFVDSPRPEQIRSQALESACQGIGDFADSSEDLDAKITLRTALLTDLPDGDESTAARANLLLTLGILHWRRGDYDKATQFLHTALDHACKLQDKPFEALCHNALALVETVLGRTREAIQAYQRALELAPEKISPWNNLGNLHYKLAQYEQALAAFQKAVEQNPSDLVSWGGLGDTYYKLGRHDDAIYAFQKNLELTPNNAHSWSSLGDVFADEGQLDDAFAAYQKALGIDRRTTASWLGLGDVYRLQGSNDNAFLAYRTAIEIDPGNARAWDELGNIYYNTGVLVEAIRAYQKAIELDRGCEQSYNKLASIFIQVGNFAEAIPLLQKGIELQAEPAEAALLWNRLGDAYRKLDDYANAMEAYRKADELDHGTAVPTRTQSIAEADPVATTKEAVVDPAVGPEPKIRPDELPPPTGPTVESAPIDVEIMDDTKSMEDESELDFAKWLDGLVAKLPLSPISGDADVSATSLNEVTETPEIETSSEAAPTLSNGTDASQPEPAHPDFAAAANPCPADKNGLSSTQSDAPDSIPVQASDDSLASDATHPQEASPVVSTPVVDPQITVPQVQMDQLGSTDQPAGSSTGSEAKNSSVDSTARADETRTAIPDPTQAEIDAKSAQIWNELGNIYYNIVAYDEAINALNKAIELDHSYGWTYNNLASIYIHKGSYAEAVPLLQKGIQLMTETKDKAILWNRLGDAYRRLDQHDQAAAAYQKAVELDPDNVSLLTRARFSLLGNCRA